MHNSLCCFLSNSICVSASHFRNLSTAQSATANCIERKCAGKSKWINIHITSTKCVYASEWICILELETKAVCVYSFIISWRIFSFSCFLQYTTQHNTEQSIVHFIENEAFHLMCMLFDVGLGRWEWLMYDIIYYALSLKIFDICLKLQVST